MIKASSSLQDLRSRLYGKRKAEWPWRHAKASDGRGGVVDGRSGHLNLGDGSRAVLESASNRIGRINLAAKCAGARSAGNPHAACEVAGAGNGATELAKRARRGKPRTRPSERPDGPPRQFPTLPTDVMNYDIYCPQALEPTRFPSASTAGGGSWDGRLLVGMKFLRIYRRRMSSLVIQPPEDVE